MRIVRYYPRAISGDGGMTNAVRRLSESMVKAGAEVVIAYEKEAGDVPESWRDNGIDWVPVRHSGPDYFRLPQRRDLESALRGADLMVLHSAWTPRNNRAGSIARHLGVPYVLEPRGAYDPHIVGRHPWMKRFWFAAFERELLMHARAVHIFFDAEREHLERLGYRGQVIVTPNGVDTTEVNWDGGSGNYVLWMGRFDPEHKGLDLIVKAVELLPETDRPRVHLHGPRWRKGKEKVAAMIDSMGLSQWIEVREQVRGPAKFNVMAQASGFIYPSRWEACSNSVAEALSVGVPTVVTPYPLGKFLAKRDAAILADPTPAGIAQAMKRLHAPQTREIAENGKRVAHNEITWDAAARSWLTQIQPLL